MPLSGVTPLQRSPFPSEVVGVDIAGQRVSLVQIRFLATEHRPRSPAAGPGWRGKGRGVGTVSIAGLRSYWVFGPETTYLKAMTSIKEDSLRFLHVCFGFFFFFFSSYSGSYSLACISRPER